MRASWTVGSVLGLVVIAGVAPLRGASLLDTGFTYQGQLKRNGVPVTETCDVEFRLFDAEETPPGQQIGDAIVFDGAGGNPLPPAIVNGLFSAGLDFGAETFNGEPRWIEIAVRCPSGDPGGYTTLDPRQPITAAPYALQTRGIFVNESGDVGIGAPSPATALDVGGTITASELVVVGSPGDATVTLPTDTISSTETAAEAGVANALQPGTVILDGSTKTLVSRTIVVPDSGYVLVLATAGAQASHTSGTASVSSFGVSTGTSFFHGRTVGFSVPLGASSGIYGTSVAVHGLFPVEAGSNTFYFLAMEFAGSVQTFSIEMTLAYFPTAYGTVGASSRAPASDSSYQVLPTAGSPDASDAVDR